MGLVFYPAYGGEAPYTIFSLEFDAKEAPEPLFSNEEVRRTTLAPGCLLVCADDDKGPRLLYKGLAKMLGATDYMILGSTYEEADGLVEIVLKAAQDKGDCNMVCIFDQNMDTYPEGRVLGTDTIKKLRASGFGGLLFIRSANDDTASRLMYKNAGADSTLSKSNTPMADLAKEVLGVYMQFLRVQSSPPLWSCKKAPHAPLILGL